MDTLFGMVGDIAGATGFYFTNGDWVGVAALVAVGLLGAVLTKNLGGAFASAVWAMPIYGFVGYVRDALSLSPSETFNRSPWLEALDDGWITVTRMSGLELIGLYFALVLVILILYLLKNAVSRG